MTRTVRNMIIPLLTVIILMFSAPILSAARLGLPEVFSDVFINVDTTFPETALISFMDHKDAGAWYITATEAEGDGLVSSWVRVPEGRDERTNVLLSGLEPDTEYILEISSVGGGREPEIWMTGITFRTASRKEGVPIHQPISYISGIEDMDDRKGTFTAVISTVTTPGLSYEASIVRDTRSSRDRSDPVVMPIGDTARMAGLTHMSEITVRHGKNTPNGVIWSDETTKMTFPEDIRNHDSEFTLSVEDGTFRWTGLEGGDRVTLWLRTEDGGSIELDTAEASESGRFSWKEEKGLTSGLYYASTGEQISSPIFWTSGPAVTVKKDQQNITLTWKEPEGSAITYTGIMTPAKDKYGNITLKVSNLDSNTEYPFRITANFADGRKAVTELTVKTESFAGVYEWKAEKKSSKTVSSFAVTVREAPASSDFGYWIYTNPNDPKCIEDGDRKAHRLMPLYDESYGDKIPSGFVSFSSDDDATASYRWNEGKWNKGSLHPNSWRPESMKIRQDKYESVVTSKAAFGVKVNTMTVFEFFLRDGVPMLRFRNRAEGNNASLANGALYKNLSPDPTLGEDEYTYVLTMVGR